MFQDKATSFTNDALEEIRRNGYALATGAQQILLRARIEGENACNSLTGSGRLGRERGEQRDKLEVAEP